MSPRDNERLEYLGDAVLQLITAEYLYKLNPGANEGEMTQVRSAMVNTNTLATLSEQLGVGDHLYLGKGILRGGGRNLKSLLANAFEALLGAVFLDGGYDAAYHFYLERFRALPEPVQDENHKGRLQKLVQERYGTTPFYDSVAASLPGRRREYTAVVYAGSEPLGTGHGGTKQEAEQEAARAALSAGAETKPKRAPRRRKALPTAVEAGPAPPEVVPEAVPPAESSPGEVPAAPPPANPAAGAWAGPPSAAPEEGPASS